MQQTVLITGGSRGIGAAAVLAFARAGYRVAFTWHSNQQAARNVLDCARAAAPDGAFLPLQADAADPVQMRTAVQRMLSRPVTLPSAAVMTRLRPQPLKISTPSSSARAISSVEAGISSRCSRHTRRTFCAPKRAAVSATSIATLPPPQTSTSLPICLVMNFLTSTRKFKPNCVRCSPSMPRMGCFQAPVSRNTVSDAALISSSEMSLPTSVLFLMTTPMPTMALTRSRT